MDPKNVPRSQLATHGVNAPKRRESNVPIVVWRGMLGTVVGVGRTLRVVSKKQAARWRKKLEDIDEKVRDTGGARRHDRLIALGFVLLSRAGSWTNTAILIHAAGAELSVGFLAAVLTAGQVIQWASAIVPMGLGITESGNYALFRGLGADPSIGVTVAIGKRAAQVVYAAIGLVLASVNQTVKEAKEVARHHKEDERKRQREAARSRREQRAVRPRDSREA